MYDILYIHRWGTNGWEGRIGRFELYEDYLGKILNQLGNKISGWLPKYTTGQSAGSYRRIVWRHWHLLIYRKTILSNKLMEEKYFKEKEARSTKPTA